MTEHVLRPDPEKMQYIIDCLSTEELLAQLAEECSELAQAALKYRRVLDGTNPAQISKEEAIRNLLEEIADVHLQLELLGFNSEKTEAVCREVMARKTDRWADSLDWGG